MNIITLTTDFGMGPYVAAMKGVILSINPVARLVDAQVHAYLARGFTSLDVHFGCTGGQHRSVYFAERLATHLRAAFPDVGVSLSHAEQTRWRREDP